ncbi:hypothetical protein HN51_034658 [Arachis hypogaea]
MANLSITYKRSGSASTTESKRISSSILLLQSTLYYNHSQSNFTQTGNQGLIYTVESQEHLLTVLKENWKRDKQLCTITMLCYTVHMLYLLKVMAKKVEKPIRDHIIGREHIRTTLLQ